MAAPVRLPFALSERSTVGIEWEVALVDVDSGDLRQAAQAIFEAVRPEDGTDHPHITSELLLNTVEISSGKCRTVGEAGADLSRALEEVRAAAEPLRIEVMGGGTHPFANWATQRVTDKERYATLIDRTQWWGRQMLIWGVHVHVGVRRRDHVLPIVSSLLNWFPHLQALSASSPMWAGTDTGYASNRAMMFQQLPTAGLPFQFQTWEEYESFVDDQMRTGVIEVLSDIRWDVRPSPTYGTIEIRVCDGVPTLGELAGLAALMQCLVVDLDRRLEAGETLPTMPPWHVQENKWRAARYGLEAEIILDAAGAERLVTDDLDDLLERLTPVARSLGCEDELSTVADIPRLGASYQRQRKVAAESGGDLVAVVDSVVRELRF